MAGRDRDAVDAVLGDLVAALREEETKDDEVPVTFLANAFGRLIEPRRRICAPAWSEIRGNYSAPARAALDELMAARGPGPGGLLLWHGEPGTGKSYALRALAREWRGWCDTHFVTDADAFLGGQTSYLLSALLRSNRGADGEHRWRLVVLEDAGELLAADARAVAGQGLSRLLNLADGLLGEGLRVVVLVTTNEPLRRLHPAVVRPGRTWAEVEFGELERGGGERLAGGPGTRRGGRACDLGGRAVRDRSWAAAGGPGQPRLRRLSFRRTRRNARRRWGSPSNRCERSVVIEVSTLSPPSRTPWPLHRGMP